MKINNIFKLVMISATVLLTPLFKTGGSTALAQAANTWEQKADFGGAGRDGSYSFSIGNKGYIGGGFLGGGVFQNDFWLLILFGSTLRLFFVELVAVGSK